MPRIKRNVFSGGDSGKSPPAEVLGCCAVRGCRGCSASITAQPQPRVSVPSGVPVRPPGHRLGPGRPADRRHAALQALDRNSAALPNLPERGGDARG